MAAASSMKTNLTLSLLWLASTASALQLYSDSIFTSEVSYCSTGRAVEVDRFDIRYYRNNQSIGFDINARSIAPNLNADLNIQLFAYGKSYINLSANLCDILGGALCPLPEYQFDGSFAYILPASVDINLPNIAYSVPDLDAYAQVILTNQVTGAEALCLGATLSNGKTVYDSRVQWAIGGLTIAAFVGALIHSFWPLSPYKSGPEWRFATVLSYFQHVAICGFLSLDYPVVYKRFTLNFAWSQGLIFMQPINAAINRMRSLTGGIDRTGQTFTVIAQNSVHFSRDNLGNATDAQNAARQFSRASAYTTPTVQQAPTYNLISGIETSAESLNITYPNAFMTVFIVFLLLLAVMTAIVLLTFIGVVLYSLIARRRSRSAGATEASISPTWENFRYFTWTNYMRIFLVGYTPLMIFIFWQFLHRRDSGWLAVFIAALTLVLLHLAIFGIYWHLSKLANRAHNEHDHTVPWSLRWSTVSAQFKRSGYGYILLLAGASFIEAAFIAFAQGHGLVQLIPLIVVEVAVFLAFCIWRPFANRGSNALMIIISLFKVVSYGLLIAFYANLQYNGIIRAVLGFVILAVQGIMTIILFCVVVYNLFAGILWGRKARKEALAENHERAAKMMSEKDAPAGPFLRPSIVDRRSTYAPAPTSATSVSGLESGTYRPESGYAAHGQSSPVMGENDTLLPPGAAFANHHPQYNGSPDTLGNENSEQFVQQQPGHQSYVSRPESGYSDDNRTVVGSTTGENPEKAHGAGMSRFNPKFWKKGDA